MYTMPKTKMEETLSVSGLKNNMEKPVPFKCRPVTADIRIKSQILQCKSAPVHPQVIQMATVAGFRDDSKTSEKIGNDIHVIVQDLFLNDESLGMYIRKSEVKVGGRRADIIAIRDERNQDGTGDWYIYVGEIKPASSEYNGYQNAAVDQLNDYVELFQNEYQDAYVEPLNFWSPNVTSIVYANKEYHLIVKNNGNGLYTYMGVQKDSTAQKYIDALEDVDKDELLPYNEKPDYMFM